MIHGYSKKGCSPYRMTHRANRAVKVKHNQTFRIFLGALIFAFVGTITPVNAIETTKASVIQSSALNIEEARLNGSLSYKKTPHNANADPCRSLLKAKLLSPGSPRREYAKSSYRRPVSGLTGSTATPVALGLFLGVRVALGPKDVIKSAKRVQVGPEIRANGNRGNSYALAIAAYRSCKNDHVLGLQNNKNKKDDVNF